MKLIAEIKIFSKEDRKTVAGILVDNGYTVGTGKRQKTPNGKSVDCQCRKFYSEQPRTVIIIKQIGKENEHE